MVSRGFILKLTYLPNGYFEDSDSGALLIRSF